jgi:polysaccharide biosynthesis protein PslG
VRARVRRPIRVPPRVLVLLVALAALLCASASPAAAKSKPAGARAVACAKRSVKHVRMRCVKRVVRRMACASTGGKRARRRCRSVGARYRSCMRHHSRKRRVRCVKRARKHSPRKPSPPPAPADSSVSVPAGNAPPVAPGHIAYGLNAGESFDRMKAALPNLTYAREDMCWAQFEPVQGSYDWSSIDSFVLDAAKQNLTTLALLNCSPAWTGLKTFEVPSSPAALADYARMVGDVVARYGPGGALWQAHPEVPYHPVTWFEVWNEPYISDFMQNPGGPDPGIYARLVKAAAEAGRARNPSVHFLAEADTYAIQPNNARAPWADGMYAAVPNLNDYIDAVAVHPYAGVGRDPSIYTPGNKDRSYFRRIEEMRAAFVAHGAADKHFWITEIGWSTCPANSGCVSEQQQADYLSYVISMAKSYGWVDAILPFRYRDDYRAASYPSDSERWYGLLRPDFSPKPAFDVLRRAMETP